MAMFVPGSGGRGSGRRAYRPMSDINVTPMVDVMLVLLIIFMVTAPLLTAGVEVDLPKTQAGTLKGDDKPLTVYVKADGSVYLQETELKLEELGPRMLAVTREKFDTRIFVKADKTIDYGRVMAVMGALGVAGFTKVGLVTEPPQQASATPGRKGR